MPTQEQRPGPNDPQPDRGKGPPDKCRRGTRPDDRYPRTAAQPSRASSSSRLSIGEGEARVSAIEVAPRPSFCLELSLDQTSVGPPRRRTPY